MIVNDLVCPGELVVWAAPHIGEKTMRLRLTWHGYLRASEATAAEKHEMRKDFHKQLKFFWQVHPWLSRKMHIPPNLSVPAISLSEHIASEYPRLGYRFVPLVLKISEIDCAVNILMLRDDPPGKVIQSGDLDRRVTTIIDALKMPGNLSELGGHNSPTEGEDPFFCLLEDDALITQLSVETDTLLQAVDEEKGFRSKQDVRLLIKVDLTPTFDGAAIIQPPGGTKSIGIGLTETSVSHLTKDQRAKYDGILAECLAKSASVAKEAA